MDESQRVKLNEMIEENNTLNHTDEIRNLRHSKLIREDIAKIQYKKKKLRTTHFKTLDTELRTECVFLITNYSIIYTKLLNNDLDITILYKFLDVLESIEDGTKDQHDASYEIGLLLKKMYIDTKIEDRSNVSISWKEYYNSIYESDSKS